METQNLTYAGALAAFATHTSSSCSSLGFAGKDKKGRTLYKTVNKLTRFINSSLNKLSSKWGYTSLTILNAILLDYSSDCTQMTDILKQNLNHFAQKMNLPKLQFSNTGFNANGNLTTIEKDIFQSIVTAISYQHPHVP